MQPYLFAIRGTMVIDLTQHIINMNPLIQIGSQPKSPSSQRVPCALTLLAVLLMGGLTAFAQTSDPSPAGFALLGKIKPRAASEISGSVWSVGGETLEIYPGIPA
jgi:hypothetical protein